MRAGHPWVFADSVQSENRPGQSGELAVIYGRDNRFLALGLFDPDSPIRVRVLHVGKPEPVDAGWWERRLAASLQKRVAWFNSETTGYRCINGESDGWPGLVLDRYDQSLVLKIYTAAWLPRLPEVLSLLVSQCAPERIVLRLSRNVQETAARHGYRDGQIVQGTALTEPVVFLETGLRFEADLVLGQKTGFFLDQRENRRRIETLAKGRRVLNAFSFSGGFSVYAARGEAAAVTDLDISAHALESSRRNFALNTGDPRITKCAHHRVQTDVYDWLARARPSQFELVILDPPSLAKRESERAGAIRSYQKLAALGLACLAPGGILLAASCSAHVTAEEFFQAVRRAVSDSCRAACELLTMRHAPDHPSAFREAEYLKAIYLRIG